MNNQTIRLPDFITKVTVTLAPVPMVLAGATAGGVLWQAAPGRFLLDIPGVARYLVESGQTITMDLAPGIDASIVERYLLMTPLAALLYQRGKIVLHAAVAANESGAVLLAGDSGCGKSTLLAALLKRGWKMLTDDLAAIDFDEHGQVLVQPVCPEIRLWPDAVKLLNVDDQRSFRIATNSCIILNTDSYLNVPTRLRSVFCLSPSTNDEIELISLESAARFLALAPFTYNGHIADLLLDRSAYLCNMAHVTREVSVSRLKRPRGRWSVEELADTVTDQTRKSS